MAGVYLKKIISIVTLTAFIVMSVAPSVSSQTLSSAALVPEPGTMVNLSPAFNPPVLKGVKVDPNDPLRFDFILDKGDSDLTADALKDESNRLIRYFLASLTVPEKDLWVNLSPYEKDRIITNEFGQTEMGRDLLAQDYLLKQLTASVIYPEGETGKKFWAEVYKRASEKYGTTDIPMDTFNKVWIVPEKAVVYEKTQTSGQEGKEARGRNAVAYVVDAKLKVMLESDYLAAEKSSAVTQGSVNPTNETQELAKRVIREIIIPVLEKEVNEGQNFAQLRQVYHSLILAAWYKRKVKDSLLSAVYVDRKKIAGVNTDNPQMPEKIWAQYVDAFKMGAYNLIREEKDEISGELIPRKYFSGGILGDMSGVLTFTAEDPAGALSDKAMLLQVDLGIADQAMKVPGRNTEAEKGDVSFVRTPGTIAKVKIAQWMVKNILSNNGTVDDNSPEFQQFASGIKSIMTNLLNGAGIKTPFNIYFVNIDEPNAMVFPYAKTVLITHGLLWEMARWQQRRPFTKGMMAAILAHELVHWMLTKDKEQEPIFQRKDDQRDQSVDDLFGAGLEFRRKAFVHLLDFREESLADTRSLKLMDTAGYNPGEAVEAARFLQFMQDQEWLKRMRMVETASRTPEETLELLEDIRREKVATQMMPSIIDTHPRPENRADKLYIMTLNRSFRHENALPEVMPIPDIPHGSSHQQELWNDMMRNVRRDQIKNFIDRVSSVKEAQDLSLLYFMMGLAGNHFIYWRSSYDMMDARLKDPRQAVVDGYRSIPYVEIALTYLKEQGEEVSIDELHLILQPDLPGQAPIKITLKAIEEKINEWESYFEQGDEEDEVSRGTASKYELTHLRMYYSLLTTIFNQDYYDISIPFAGLEVEDIYRKLFTPWMSVARDEKVLDDPLLSAPFQLPEYREVLSKAREVFDKENPGISALEKDLRFWLNFHSYYPTRQGMDFLKRIKASLKNPAVLLRVLKDLPVLQHEDPRLRKAFKGYDGFAFLDMLANFFIPEMLDALINNEVFENREEMYDFVNDLLQATLYFKAAVSHEGNRQHNPFDEHSRKILQRLISSLKTRDDVEHFADFLSEASLLAQGSLDEKYLAVKIKELNILGADAEADLALLKRLARKPVTNALAQAFFHVYPKKQYFLKAIPLMGRTEDFKGEIWTFVLTKRARDKMGFWGSLKRLAQLNVVMSPLGYEKLFEKLKDKTDPREFLEGLKFIRDRHVKLGQIALKHYSSLPSWEERGELHFRILKYSFPDDKNKIAVLKDLVESGSQEARHYQRAIDALEGIGASRKEFTRPRFMTIVTMDDKLKDFTRRRKDQAYHETHMTPLKDPRELEAPYDQLFLQKLELGKEGWGRAKAETPIENLGYQERLDLVRSFFPDPSTVRDEILGEISKDQAMTFDQHVQTIQAFENPVQRIQFGKKALEALRKSEPGHFSTFEKARDSILELLPDYSLERDRQLSKLTDEYADADYRQTESLKRFYIEGNEEYSTDETVIFTMAGMETFRDYVRLAQPADKIEVILWMLNLSVKPDIIEKMEQSMGYKLSLIKELSRESGDAENRIFLQEVLLGHNGVFTTGTPEERRYFLDKVFTMIVPDDYPMDQQARLKLHNLFQAIFRFATPKRRTDMILTLFNARNQKVTLPQMIRLFLQSYGPLGIKTGQYLATRTNFLPEDIREELLNLFDKADPMLKHDFFEALMVSYDVDNPEKVFKKIGQRRGSASFKQVHDAEVYDSSLKRIIQATAKVIRPAAIKEILSDLRSFDQLIDYINKEADFFGFALPKDMGKELRRRVFEEMDFKSEAARQERIRLNVERRSPKFERIQVQVPRVIPEFTRDRSFVDEKAPGVPLTSKNIPSRFSMEDISKVVVREFLDEIFLDGFYHGDPHPGNIFLSDDGILSLIDFGITGTLSLLNRERLFELVQNVMFKNKQGVRNLIIEFYSEMEESDRPNVSLEDIDAQVERIFGQGFDAKQIGKSLYMALDGINRLGIRLPEEWYSLLGTLTELDYWLSQINNVQGFLFGLIMKYRMHHEKEKAVNPFVRKDIAGFLETMKRKAAEAEAKPPVPAAPVQAVTPEAPATPEVKRLQEIWKVESLKAGTRMRFVGEGTEWKVSFDAPLKTDRRIVIQQHSDDPVEEDAYFLEKRGKAIVNKWVIPRLPMFPNDGIEFRDDKIKGNFSIYMLLMREQGHRAATRTYNKWDNIGYSIKSLVFYYDLLETWNINEVWDHFLEGKESFERYLFERLGIPKNQETAKYDWDLNTTLEGLYESISAEIDRGHVIQRTIKINEETLEGMEIFNDEKWEKFGDFRLTKGIEGNGNGNHVADKPNGGDQAMSSSGGIDLNSVNAALSVDSSGAAIRFHIDPVMFEQFLAAPGFIPVIINIQPMTSDDLPKFLGLNDDARPAPLALSPGSASLERIFYAVARRESECAVGLDTGVV